MIIKNLILMITLVEIFLRLLGYPFDKIGIPHPIYHHTHKPNTIGKCVKPGEFSVVYKINKWGMRDKKRTLIKLNRKKRILVLGDSFVEGYGVKQEKTFCSLLEKKFKEKVEIINGGCISFSPMLEKKYYENFAYKFKSDIVMLFLDWSDIQDDYNYNKKWNIRDNNRSWLVNKSAIVNFFYTEQIGQLIKRKIIGKFLKFILGKIIFNNVKSKFGLSGYPTVKIGDVESDRYLMFRDEYINKLKDHIARTQKNILDLKHSVEKNNAKFILVVYPMGVQLNEYEWKEGKEYYGFAQNKVYGDKLPFEMFENFAKQNNITFLNLYDDFLFAAEDLLFFPEDGHFTEAGHEVVAESLYSFLRKFFPFTSIDEFLL